MVSSPILLQCWPMSTKIMYAEGLTGPEDYSGPAFLRPNAKLTAADKLHNFELRAG